MICSLERVITSPNGQLLTSHFTLDIDSSRSGFAVEGFFLQWSFDCDGFRIVLALKYPINGSSSTEFLPHSGWN